MKLPKIKLSIVIVLNIIAGVIVFSTFLKALIDLDIYSYDTWLYHLPFAARIWGIVPDNLYIFEDNEEIRWQGFTILGEFLQGFFWFIFRRMQAANLVSFFSLIIYIYFLGKIFQVPFYLSVIALFAIPLVQIHLTTCYVDLLGNISLSTVIMMTYLLYVNKDYYTPKHLGIMFLGAAVAANTKPQLIPLVCLPLFFSFLRIIVLDSKNNNQTLFLRIKQLSILLIASLIIFATPVKNIIIYQNPFYPVRIEIAGIVLNHKLPLYNDAPEQLKTMSRPQRWLYSILEVRSAKWSVDQGEPKNSYTHRMGGFFGAYVAFNIVLFAYLVYHIRSRESKVAAILFLVMSLVASSFPQSHELRYYMYWIITLVSLNLFLVRQIQLSQQQLKWINQKNLGIICLVFLMIVFVQTRAMFVRPKFQTLDYLFTKKVFGQDLQKIKQDIQKINADDQVCVIGKQPYTFLYASKFYPELNYSYSVEASVSEKGCSFPKIIR